MEAPENNDMSSIRNVILLVFKKIMLIFVNLIKLE